MILCNVINCGQIRSFLLSTLTASFFIVNSHVYLFLRYPSIVLYAGMDTSSKIMGTIQCVTNVH